MIVDYAHFGDVITFDTTFGTNKESRPFGVFVRFNHFRQTTIFGAALMYDETFESFKWLFETFIKAHNGEQPRTIFTDQDSAMTKAIEMVFTEAWYGLCSFHIMQNAVKHLSQLENEGPSLLSDFTSCMFKYEDNEKFEQEFNTIRSKMNNHIWLDNIYKFKEKWVECHMKDVFTLEMRSTQLSESLNSDLKDHFKSNFNMIRFLKHFERVVQGKRDKELGSLFEDRKKISRVKIKTPILLQACKLYTPIIFEAFQTEYERSTTACARALGENRGRRIFENPMFDDFLRYRYLSHKFLSLVQQAAKSLECCLLVDNTLDILAKQVEEKMGSCSTAREDQCPAHKDFQAPNESLSNAGLKKKKIQTKGSKRKRTWQDNKRKGRRKIQTTTILQEGKADQKEARKDGGKTQIAMACTSGNNLSNFTEYEVINSFTQLLMYPSAKDLSIEDMF